jgi:hypothetical protein
MLRQGSTCIKLNSNYSRSPNAPDLALEPIDALMKAAVKGKVRTSSSYRYWIDLEGKIGTGQLLAVPA